MTMSYISVRGSLVNHSSLQRLVNSPGSPALSPLPLPHHITTPCRVPAHTPPSPLCRGSQRATLTAETCPLSSQHSYRQRVGNNVIIREREHTHTSRISLDALSEICNTFRNNYRTEHKYKCIPVFSHDCRKAEGLNYIIALSVYMHTCTYTHVFRNKTAFISSKTTAYSWST